MERRGGGDNGWDEAVIRLTCLADICFEINIPNSSTMKKDTLPHEIHRMLLVTLAMDLSGTGKWKRSRSEQQRGTASGATEKWTPETPARRRQRFIIRADQTVSPVEGYVGTSYQPLYPKRDSSNR